MQGGGSKKRCDARVATSSLEIGHPPSSITYPVLFQARLNNGQVHILDLSPKQKSHGHDAIKKHTHTKMSCQT